jgi:site-specific DNA-methyltransferase (adenine-specific)
MSLPINQVYLGDCLELMNKLDDNSVDMILCDLPYGTTACAWDVIIPFEEMWKQYRRVTKPNAAIVLTAAQPFTSALVASNIKFFKQELIWSKGKGSYPLIAKKRIMQAHENILVFCYGRLPYNPQMMPGKPYKAPRTGGNRTNSITGTKADKAGFKQEDNTGFRYPLSVLDYSIHCGSKLHPSQKPTELFEYLIKTYSNPGDVILDNTAGSGTTGVAAVNTGRNFILMEKEEKYWQVCKDRIGAK